jgi:FkbM family methyltransferase
MTPEFAELDRKLLSSLIGRGFAPSTIFDIGASDGAWTRAAEDLFPSTEFHLFEPLADHSTRYMDRIHSLAASDGRFHLHKHAVGRSSGSLDIHIFPDAAGSTTLHLDYSFDDVKTINVDVVSVDDLIVNRGLPVPQLIKMDIQGGELEALKGAAQTLPYVDVLLLETWLTRGYGSATPLLSELCEFLRGYGFWLWDFGDEYRDADGTLVSKDCLFLNVISPLSPMYEPAGAVQ